MQTHRRTFLACLAISSIRYYQITLSHIMLHSCRFFPTCSEYAIEAVERYGAARGIWRVALRLLRCQPLSPGGLDPVR